MAQVVEDDIDRGSPGLVGEFRLPGEIAEGDQIESGEDRRQVVFSVAEICVRTSYSLVFRASIVSFSIFHLDLPSAARSSTLSASTGRLDEAVAIGDLAVELRMVISSQLTSSVSLPSRIGRPSIQRQV